MNNLHALSIAAFDPTGGAGILADIKTFEAHHIRGTAALTGYTFQNDVCFESVTWLSESNINRQIESIMARFAADYVKIGLIENFDRLENIINNILEKRPGAKLIWDPVMESSTGFIFHHCVDHCQVERISGKIFMITPNIPEIKKLTGASDPAVAAEHLSNYCHVLLKGGHKKEDPWSTDTLFMTSKCRFIPTRRIMDRTKHGTGCVLSSAITANLCKGYSVLESCKKAKEYVTKFILSSASLIGNHCYEN